MPDDYVSRQWLIDEYHRRHKGPPGGALKMIEEAPAADVEGKRMTGVWLEQDEMPNVRSDKIYRCSVCGYADEQSPSAEVPYCWHCGSKMKREVK